MPRNKHHINVDRIVDQIRSEAMNIRYSDSDNTMSSDSSFANKSIHLIDLELDNAENSVGAGGYLPPFLSIPAPFRWFARIFGRIVLFFAQVFTIQQRSFNKASLNLILLLLTRISYLEIENRKFSEKLDEQNKEIEKLINR